MKEEVNGVELEHFESNEQACSYDVEHFIMFYGNILNQLRVGPPFTHFQVSILNSFDVCPSQLTWNALAFILIFKVVSLHLEVKPLLKSFFFFFSHTQTKNEGWTHFL